MKQDYSSIATSKFTGKKLILIVYMIFCAAMLMYLTINAPLSRAQAEIYFWIIILAIAISAFSFAVKKKTQYGMSFPHNVLWEDEGFGGWKITRRLGIFLVMAVFILGLLSFWVISNQTAYQIVSAPSYKVAEVGVAKNVILDIVSASTEDFMWFGAMPGLVFLIGFYLFSRFGDFKKAYMMALLLVLIAVPFIFMSYHSLRYGFLTESSISVLLFGAMSTVWVVVFRNLLFPLVMHAANNAALAFFALVAVDVSLFVFAGIAIILILGFYKLAKAGRSDLSV